MRAVNSDSGIDKDSSAMQRGIFCWGRANSFGGFPSNKRAQTNRAPRGQSAMMGGMGSMMTGMMGFGWVPMLIAVALVVGAVVVLVKLVTPAEAPAAGVGNVILAVLAVIGGVALVAALAMGTMHFGMMR